MTTTDAGLGRRRGEGHGIKESSEAVAEDGKLLATTIYDETSERAGWDGSQSP